MKFVIICTCLIAYVAADISLGSEVPIVSQNAEINPDGSYSWGYETGNGIQAQESGIGGANAQGSYSYQAPDGSPISVSYTADENGYRAEGDSIPVPPPIPEAILKALAYIEANPPPPQK